jgi:hypothetical protein
MNFRMGLLPGWAVALMLGFLFSILIKEAIGFSETSITYY